MKLGREYLEQGLAGVRGRTDKIKLHFFCVCVCNTLYI